MIPCAEALALATLHAILRIPIQSHQCYHLVSSQPKLTLIELTWLFQSHVLVPKDSKLDSISPVPMQVLLLLAHPSCICCKVVSRLKWKVAPSRYKAPGKVAVRDDDDVRMVDVVFRGCSLLGLHCGVSDCRCLRLKRRRQTRMVHHNHECESPLTLLLDTTVPSILHSPLRGSS